MTTQVISEVLSPRWRRPRRLALLAAIAGFSIAVPVVLANNLFSDVATSNPHHDDISAIALAGVTTGCGPGVYCPEDNVTRQQMASFLRRGFGRVARGILSPTTNFPGGTASWSYTITSGVPSGALTGANGFVKVDAFVTVQNGTGITCQIVGNALIDGLDVVPHDPTDVVTASSWRTIALTGVTAVSGPGVKTITIQISDGCSSQTAWGNSTATYFPFGSMGTNALEVQANE